MIETQHLSLTHTNITPKMAQRLLPLKKIYSLHLEDLYNRERVKEGS
jgi:hypothetical protein